MSWSELHPFIQEAVRTTLAVGLLVLLVLLIRKPFAKHYGAKAAYMLWLVPVARFVMPPLPSNWSLSGWLGLGTPAPQPAIEFVAAPIWTEAPVLIERAVAAVPSAPPVIIQQTQNTSLLEGVLAQAPLILTLVWITGTLLWLGRSLHQQRTFLSLIRDDSEPASDAILAETRLVAAQLELKRVPDVRASLLCSGPLVTGLKDPVVLLPLWFEEDYTREEQRDALIHELMHLKRRDLWAFQIARVIAATQWFNPLAHMALGAFRTDQEAACDADVLRQDRISPAAYGRTLVKAARLARPSDRRIAAASLTLAHPIKERLIMMQHPKPTFRSRLTGTALAGAIGAAALFTTASCMSAQAEDKETNTFVFKSHGNNDNQQMVLLGDPMAGVSPKLHALGDMDWSDFDMSFEMDFDMEELQLGELMVELEGLQELQELEMLGELGNIMSFETEVDGNGHSIFVMKAGELPEDFEDRIEAWAEQFEERMEGWEEKMEAHSEEIEARAEAMAIRIETKAEAWAEQHEAKAEAMAARIEATFDEDFETELEAATDVIESLADQCEARDEDDPTPEIVSATNAESGETFRAVCVNGDRDRLKSSELADWIQGRSDLSQAEKDAFSENRDHRVRIEISHSHDGDELEGGED